MSMYEGGKPTAVKTLGTQIAAIYEGKVVADELMDKQGRTREALPDFLKSFFIRQYGLKSIALKNLQVSFLTWIPSVKPIPWVRCA